MQNRRELVIQSLAAAAALAGAKQARAAAKIVGQQPLPPGYNGQEAVFVKLEIEPGAPSRAHRHPGIVLGYVIEGQFEFAINDEPSRVLQAGETFYEPPGVLHRMTGNPGDTTTRVLAIVFKQPDDDLTIPA